MDLSFPSVTICPLDRKGLTFSEMVDTTKNGSELPFNVKAYYQCPGELDLPACDDMTYK